MFYFNIYILFYIQFYCTVFKPLNYTSSHIQFILETCIDTQFLNHVYVCLLCALIKFVNLVSLFYIIF